MTLAAALCAALAVVVAGIGPPVRSRLRRISRPAAGTSRSGTTSRPPVAGPDQPRTVPLGSARGRAAASLVVGVAGLVVVGGLAGAVISVGLGVAAWLGLGRLEPAARARDREHVVATLPLAAHLLVAALEAGRPPVAAVEIVGKAVEGPLGDALVASARTARVHADPATGWRELSRDPALRPIGRALDAATARGTSPVVTLDRAARDAHDAARWAAEARARSLGARAAAPLGLCFLPAFVLVGIVPIVATSGLGVL